MSRAAGSTSSSRRTPFTVERQPHQSPCPWASAATIFSGVTGRSVSEVPSAWFMALTTAAAVGTIAISPTLLAPNGTLVALVLDEQHADLGHVGRVHDVVGLEAAGAGPATIVEAHLLAEGVADAHLHGAQELALDHEAVDGLAHVAHGEKVGDAR